MKFACESCRAQYMISDEKVGPRGVKFRCKRCNHTNVVRRQGTDANLAAPPRAPEPQAAPGTLEDEIGAAFDNVVSPQGEEAPADEIEAIGGDDGHLLRHADADHIFDQAEGAPVPLPPEQVEWFVAIGDQQHGPLKFEAVKERWERAEIGPDTLCWREGLSDWLPLSQLSELAGSLAPQSKAGATAPVEDAPWTAKETGPAEEPGWRPSAASALASLVAEEQEAARSDAPKKEPSRGADPLPPVESTAVRSLLEDLPEPPPVEPSRVIPLSALPGAIAAGGAAVPKTPQAPPEKKGRGGLVAGVAAAVLLLGGAGVWASGMLGGSQDPVQPPQVAVAAARAPVAPAVEETKELPKAPAAEEPTPAVPPETEAVAEAPPTGDVVPAAEPEGAAAVAEAATPEPAKAEPARVEEPPVEKPAAKTVASSAATKKRAAPEPARARAPAPAPTPAPAVAVAPPKPKRSSGDLLSAGSSRSIDDLFEKEFSSAPPPPAKKSQAVGGTYIPPAPGGGGSKPKALGQGDILAVVASHKGPLKTCATNYKSSSGQSSGTVVMRWSIRPNGKTTGVQPVKGAEHKELATCIGDLVKGWSFPPYDGPQMAPIDFPFQF